MPWAVSHCGVEQNANLALSHCVCVCVCMRACARVCMYVYVQPLKEVFPKVPVRFIVLCVVASRGLVVKCNQLNIPSLTLPLRGHLKLWLCQSFLAAVEIHWTRCQYNYKLYFSTSVYNGRIFPPFKSVQHIHSVEVGSISMLFPEIALTESYLHNHSTSYKPIAHTSRWKDGSV